MTTPKVQGRFYFKLTDSGNLLGEYINQNIDRYEPECATRLKGEDKKDNASPFAGIFISTWWESDGVRVARLDIVRKAPISNPPQPDGLYSLEWFDFKKGTKGKKSFVGEAAFSEGMLKGTYHSTF